MDGGRLAAKALAEATGGKANVLIVTYSMHAMTQIRRMEGFNEALAAYPEMVVVDTIADMGSSILLQTELERVFEEHPEIDAIFSCGASGSEGLGKSPVVRERLGKSIKVVSFDMSETIASYIEEGLYAATIAQATEQMGQYAVRALEACRAGEVYDNEIIHTDLTIVTGENLDAHRIGEGGDVTWNLY